jgi:hypothetical protein
MKMHLARNVFFVGSLIIAAAFLGCRGDNVGGGSGEACGNGVVEGDEECDGQQLAGATCGTLNLGSGELACTADCTFDAAGCSDVAECGNNVREYPEECDGTDLAETTCQDHGFDAGELGCDSQCQLDTSGCEMVTECGDGVREGNEECDGADLGGESCGSLGLGGGELGCTENCLYQVSGCDIQPECGNGVNEPGESCDGTDLAGQDCTDQGFYGGTLGCLADCTGFDVSACEGTCGDGVINGPETCDGTDIGSATCTDQGFYGGELGCEADCMSYDVSSCEGTCGDGAVNGDEVCDGGDLDGQDCTDQGYYDGTLACLPDCNGFDVSSCVGTCGDGVINGDEVCDASDLGGQQCTDIGYDGGTLACLADCTAYDTSGCTLENALVISEISLGNPDGVEILNVSGSDVDLDGWTLEWWGYDNNENVDGGVIVLPSLVLAPGERVFVADEYPGTGQPAEVDGDIIQAHVNIWWYDVPGSATLRDATDHVADFARWGGADFDPPQGTTWSDTPDVLPSFSTSDLTLSRVPDNGDTDAAQDFCVAPATLGAQNGQCIETPAPGAVLINEIGVGMPDHVELYNPGNADVELGGLRIYWTSSYGYNGDDGASILPSFTLAAGAYVEIVDDLGYQESPYVDANEVIHIHNINWAGDEDGSCTLESVAGGIDFVRWGGNTTEPALPDVWADDPSALPMVAGNPPPNLGRDPSVAADNDEAGDWCLQQPSVGSANNACN